VASLTLSPLVEERQMPLPSEYTSLPLPETLSRIARAKSYLAEQLLILGHYYQVDEIFQFADVTGDSYALAKAAAAETSKEFVVFCGVRFMAETTDILGPPHQRVMLPNLEAGCHLARMAPSHSVKIAFDEVFPQLSGKTVPVCYINSSADVKAMVGYYDGVICTSRNAKKLMEWGLSRGERIFCLPDMHLGRNNAAALGIPPDLLVLFDPMKPCGGLSLEELERAKVILWKGWCSVHQRFTPQQAHQARDQYPNVKIVVHPECCYELCEISDYVSSTTGIIKYVEAQPAGSVIAVGTEINLVSRLADQNPDKKIFCLDPIVCPCSTMYRIHPHYLLFTLEELKQGRVRNEIVVPQETASWAKIALDRMLALGE
jgi:quinolinate synthase